MSMFLVAVLKYIYAFFTLTSIRKVLREAFLIEVSRDTIHVTQYALECRIDLLTQKSPFQDVSLL